MLIIGQSGSRKTNLYLILYKKDYHNLIAQIYLYAKDLSELKYQLLIKKRKDAEIKNLDDPSAFIEYSNTMDNIYSNINDYNLKRKRTILIAFDDMIADIMANKKFEASIKDYLLDAEN